jgi:hypothetical protein
MQGATTQFKIHNNIYRLQKKSKKIIINIPKDIESKIKTVNQRVTGLLALCRKYAARGSAGLGQSLRSFPRHASPTVL